MAKLQMLTDSSLEGDNGDPLTHLTKLFKETKETDEGHLYQHIKLLKTLRNSLLGLLTKK